MLYQCNNSSKELCVFCLNCYFFQELGEKCSFSDNNPPPPCRSPSLSKMLYIQILQGKRSYHGFRVSPWVFSGVAPAPGKVQVHHALKTRDDPGPVFFTEYPAKPQGRIRYVPSNILKCIFFSTARNRYIYYPLTIKT